MADDELIAHGSASIRSIQHDPHRTVYAVNELDLHVSSTMRASNSSYRRLDSLFQFRLELLVGAIGRFVFRVKYFIVNATCEDILSIFSLIGAACLLAGLVITAIDMIFPHQFSTILEVDYDTPYDRHVIIEESFDTRNVRRKVPKIEDSFGDRIMR